MPNEPALTRMSDDKLPSNSKVAKDRAEKKPAKKQEDERHFEKVVTSTPVQKKRGIGKKFSETFLGDNFHNVGEYILFDVLIPAAKATVSDIVSQGIEMLMFGESGSRSRNTRRDGGRSYISYNNYSRDRGNQRDRQTRTINRRAAHSFDDIILESRSEAEEVLDNLIESTVQYGYASVADLYDLVGITHNYTDQKWGWDNLNNASVRRVREGYLIELPKAKVLDD